MRWIGWMDWLVWLGLMRWEQAGPRAAEPRVFIVGGCMLQEVSLADGPLFNSNEFGRYRHGAHGRIRRAPRDENPASKSPKTIQSRYKTVGYFLSPCRAESCRLHSSPTLDSFLNDDFAARAKAPCYANHANSQNALLTPWFKRSTPPAPSPQIPRQKSGSPSAAFVCNTSTPRPRRSYRIKRPEI
jgi:hypothetical protein